jgi:PKD repeat protein
VRNRSSSSRRHNQSAGRNKRRLPFVALESLEGRSLFSGTTSLGLEASLSGPNPAEFQSFGASIATKGNLLLVGTAAVYDTTTGALIASGTATLYDTTTGTPTVKAKYDAPEGSPSFGSAVSFFGTGESFAISAPLENGGAVYVYLTPTTATGEPSSPIPLTAAQYGYNEAAPRLIEQSFGAALAGYGDHLLVTTTDDRNFSYDGVVRQINPVSGDVIRTFLNPDASPFNFDDFGAHLAVSGDQILFHAPTSAFSDPENPLDDLDSGPSNVYLHNGSTFTITFPDPAANPRFQYGASMAFSGDNVVIAAPAAGFDENFNTLGSPVYQYSAATGQLLHTYAQPASVPTESGSTYAAWGRGLTATADKLMIGAPFALNAGRVYVYDLATHAEIASAVAPNQGGNFGTSLASLPGDRFVVADPASNAGGFSAGQVHVYALTTTEDPDNSAPPTADAGDDLFATAGLAVPFSATDSTPAAGRTITTFEWDFDNDGTFDAFTPDASHIFTAAGTYTVTLRVTDDAGKSATDTLDVTVTLPAPPTADAGAAQTADTNQTVSFAGTAAAAPGATVASVTWDFDFDGTTFNTDATGLNPTHAFPAAGTYVVAIRVTDNFGQFTTDTTLVTVTEPTSTPGPVGLDASGNLVVNAPTGSTGLFQIRRAADGSIAVSGSATDYGTFAPTGSIIIYGSPAGNVIVIADNVVVPVFFSGGPGTDLVQGGGGNDVLLGGGGLDVLSGGSGRDLLIGGTGSDVLLGSANDDILIAGTTAFDNNPAALAAILAEWSSGRSYTQRVNNLRNASPTADRANGSVFLIADSTVFNDNAMDVLAGNAGDDWFLFNNDSGARDVLAGRSSNELITDLDLIVQ